MLKSFAVSSGVRSLSLPVFKASFSIALSSSYFFSIASLETSLGLPSLKDPCITLNLPISFSVELKLTSSSIIFSAFFLVASVLKLEVSIFPFNKKTY